MEGNNDQQNSQFKLYPQRFYVLIIFSILSAQQAAFWLTFSPIASQTRSYYKISDSQINFFLAYGPIVYLPVVFFTSWILDFKKGLRYCILISVILEILASGIRCLSLIHPHHWSSFYILSLAQILNAAVGPLVMAPPSFLSATWFGENERTTATAIANLSNSLGTAVGFLFSPYVLKWFSFPILLFSFLFSSVILGILCFIYFPAYPLSPPSQSNFYQIEVNNLKDKRYSFLNVLNDILKSLMNPYFFILSLIGGGIAGVFQAWTGEFDIILAPYGFSDTESGFLGFGSTTFGLIGSLLIGILGDTILKKKFKIILIILFGLSTLFSIWFALAFPNLFIDKPFFKMPKIVLAIPPCFLGFFIGATSPLFYELGAELTYPLNESISGSVLSLMNNIGCLIFLMFGSYLSHSLINSLMAIITFISAIGTLFVKEEYKRENIEIQNDSYEKENLLGDQLFRNSNDTIN